MDVILPVGLFCDKEIVRCALQLNFDEFAALKLLFITNHCDLDVYETLGDERIQLLIYGWEICTIQLCGAGAEIPPPLIPIVKLLAHHTLHIWLSQEWKHCNNTLKEELLIYLDQAQYIFAQIESLAVIDWPYLLTLGVNPWRVSYLQHFGLTLKDNEQSEIEHTVASASGEDIEYLKREGVMIIVLRLINLFNSSSWESVKQLSLRALAAWLATTHTGPLDVAENEQRCLILMGHIYLMALFAADDNRGYIIDNMMHNIRFYCYNIQSGSETITDVEYTPARLIALVCIRLNVDKNLFFERFVYDAYDMSFNKLFGVISQAYISYVLGNMLMELMAMNEEDFNLHLEEFKQLINRYVDEREKSEKYLLNEIKKRDAQKNSWARPNTIDMKLDYKCLICKGNRASNFGNYNYDDDGIKLSEAEQLLDEERDRRIDPIFQNIPNNELVLSYAYGILAKRGYSGWHFAKVVVLLKIIGHKMNKIETWRYHPGLSTDFMLNLEKQLSAHYADLAKIFNEYHFMEQELWLTAFYLYPSSEYYGEVKRCGIRFNRRRNNTADDDARDASAVTRSDKQEMAKFGLLSSTIHVNQILRISNPEAPNSDYEPIAKALLGLRLPERVLKDLLTVTFLARNKSFSWALDWTELRDCCRDFIKKSKIKKRFVELNMSEANDRLKFLEIDYEKYKHRPQLDYGTIEEGYEHVANSGDAADPDSHTNDECDDLEFDCEVKKDGNPTKLRQTRRKFWDEESISEKSGEDSDDSEAYYAGTRRTRARTAAVIATTMFRDESGRRVQRGNRSGLISTSDSESSRSTTPLAHPSSPKGHMKNVTQCEKKLFNDVLQSCVRYSNTTNGFDVFTDIWSFENNELENVAVEANVLMESNSMLGQLNIVKDLKKTLPRDFQTEHIESSKTIRTMEDKKYTHSVTNAGIDLEKTPLFALFNESTHHHFGPDEMLRKSLNNDSGSSTRSDTSIQAHKDLDESIDGGTSDDPGDYINEEPGIPQNSNLIEVEADVEQQVLKEHIEIETVYELIEETSRDILEDTIVERETLLKIQEGQEENSTSYKKQTNESLNEGHRMDELIKENHEHEESDVKALNTNKEFTSRYLSVRVRRLRADEIAQLRQPRVRIKRLNLDDMTQRQPTSTCKRRRIYDGLTVNLNTLTDDGSGSGSSSSTNDQLRSTRRKRQLNNRTQCESSTDAEDNAGSSTSSNFVRRRTQRQLIATPRSASGLKMRISSLQHEHNNRDMPDSFDQIECIQLSTSSSSSPIDGEGSLFRLSPVPESMSAAIIEDPLYEEEVVPYR